MLELIANHLILELLAQRVLDAERMRDLTLAENTRLKSELDELRGAPASGYPAFHGRHGGLARAAKLTPEQRTDIARRAAQHRWGRRDLYDNDGNLKVGI
jgi:hypothetical protein